MSAKEKKIQKQLKKEENTEKVKCFLAITGNPFRTFILILMLK